MTKGIVGKKLGMSQLYVDDRIVPVTIVEAGPCVVTQVKTEATDGYAAVQLGFEDLPKRKVNKPVQGHFDKGKVEPKRHLVELRFDDAGPDADFEVGQELKVDIFEVGETAEVTGTSKGKGFSGPMKRWNFSGLGASHGAHGVHRAPGSIGSSATPSRVLPGRRMAGRYGGDRVTVRGLKIVRVEPERNLIALRGAVPGPTGSLVTIRVKS